MATEKLSAYTDRGDLLTTQLNSLASGSHSGVGTALDNGTNLDRFASAVLNVTFGSAPTDKSTCSLFMVPAVDGSNYADGGSSVRPSSRYYVGSFELRNVTTAQKVTIPRFELMPCAVKFVLLNSSGQAFPASGSTVEVHTFNRTVS